MELVFIAAVSALQDATQRGHTMILRRALAVSMTAGMLIATGSPVFAQSKRVSPVAMLDTDNDGSRPRGSEEGSFRVVR
jgi:hypothetical protein